jgi:putative ABC transport system permease protein
MKIAMLVFRAALGILPAAFRERNRTAMEALFQKAYTEARQTGRLAASTVVVAATFDAITVGLSRRWSALRTQPSPQSRTGAKMVFGFLGHDLRYAIRSLKKAPRYTLVAIVTLALGIGANSAIFAVVNGVMLQPLPFEAPDRVVHVGWEEDVQFFGWMTPFQYEFWRDNTNVFGATTTFTGFSAPLGTEENGGMVQGLQVSHQFLDVVGMRPTMGRSFSAADDEPGAIPVIMIGQRMWQDHFLSDRDVIGRTVVVAEKVRIVIGVLPGEFDFPQAPENTDALIPLGLRADPQDEGQNYPFLARLTDGVTYAQADAQVRTLTSTFKAAHPNLMVHTTMRLSSYQEIFVGGLRSTLTILMAAISLVLLIACANVANLSLVRASGRARELAVRTALGATRRRIISQVLVESLLVAGAGGLVGLAVAPTATNLLLALSPGHLPRLEQVTLDWSVVGYTLFATLITGLAVGAVGAVAASRHTFANTLKEGARGSTERGKTRQALLAFETALSMVLLVGAGLLISTLRELNQVDSGFDRTGLVTAQFGGTARGYRTGAEVAELERQVIEILQGHPAVDHVAGASSLPLERDWNLPVTIAGRPADFEGAVEWRGVSHGYLETLGVALVRGRGFRASDNTPGAPRVAIINESFATHYFGTENPLGQGLEIGKYDGRYMNPGFDVPAAEIVGVMADVRDMSLKREARRTVMVPHVQAPDYAAAPPVFLIRAQQPAVVAELVRSAIANADPTLPIPIVRQMSDVAAATVATERFNAVLMSTFAGLALLLTMVGVYGVVAYDARTRAPEIGIRMALGARGNDVLRLTLLRGIRPVLLGLVVGIAAALALSRVISSMLWGVSPSDPLTIVTVAAILAGTAALASYIPARESARADPGMALRG